MKTVMIISDATGETAERMVRAATLQFSEPVQIRLFSRVRLESEINIARANHVFDGHVIWMVSSTAAGGGVAEMLRSFLGYARGVGVNVRWLYDTEGGADWEARAGAALEYRRFGGPAHCPPDGLSCPGTVPRNDEFLIAQGELTRTGRVLLTLGYAFHYNASNSFRETLSRHIGFTRVATALPFGLYLAARADLLFAFYRDPIPVAQTTDTSQMVAGKPFATIEDENRSSVRVDLSRDIIAPLRAILRYTFYANELGGNSGTYRRNTLLLSLAFTYEK